MRFNNLGPLRSIVSRDGYIYVVNLQKPQFINASVVGRIRCFRPIY